MTARLVDEGMTWDEARLQTGLSKEDMKKAIPAYYLDHMPEPGSDGLNAKQVALASYLMMQTAARLPTRSIPPTPGEVVRDCGPEFGKEIRRGLKTLRKKGYGTPVMDVANARRDPKELDFRRAYQAAQLADQGIPWKRAMAQAQASTKDMEEAIPHWNKRVEDKWADGGMNWRQMVLSSAMIEHIEFQKMTLGQELGASLEELLDACGHEHEDDIAHQLQTMHDEGMTGRGNSGEDNEQDEDDGLINLRDTLGRKSHLVPKLTSIIEESTDKEAVSRAVIILTTVLRRSTKRIVLDTEQFLRITADVGTPVPEGAFEGLRWPSDNITYIELSEPLSPLPVTQEPILHGLIIGAGEDNRQVLIAYVDEDGRKAFGKMFMMDMSTGMTCFTPGTPPEATAGIPEGTLEHLGELLRRIIAYMSAKGTAIVEQPLTRQQRRQMERKGQANPWHIISTGHDNQVCAGPAGDGKGRSHS